MIAASTKAGSTEQPPESQYEQDPKVVLLESCNLIGVSGARIVIKEIRKRQDISELILNFNELENSGTMELFRFLRTREGRAHSIIRIELLNNSIGDDGLMAIMTYLRGNVHLKDIHLWGNIFQGNEKLGSAFGVSINNSRLTLVDLTANEKVASAFFKAFMVSLNSTTLRVLHMSFMNLRDYDAQALKEYLSSPRSRSLQVLTCNMNKLGEKAAVDIIHALKSKNFTLQRLEMDGHLTHDLHEILELVVARNHRLLRLMHCEAFRLLQYSRTLLLRSSRYSRSKTPRDQTSSVNRKLSLKTASGPSGDNGERPIVPIFMLPTELLHHILSFLTVTLSRSQYMRIFTYAARRDTMSHVFVPLADVLGSTGLIYSRTKVCLPNPASQFPGSYSRACMARGCKGVDGTEPCGRADSRLGWLDEVDCMQFDIQDLDEEDVMRLVS